jgi:hypothetical protein
MLFDERAVEAAERELSILPMDPSQWVRRVLEAAVAALDREQLAEKVAQAIQTSGALPGYLPDHEADHMADRVLVALGLIQDL